MCRVSRGSCDVVIDFVRVATDPAVDGIRDVWNTLVPTCIIKGLSHDLFDLTATTVHPVRVNPAMTEHNTAQRVVDRPRPPNVTDRNIPLP